MPQKVFMVAPSVMPSLQSPKSVILMWPSLSSMRFSSWKKNTPKADRWEKRFGAEQSWEHKSRMLLPRRLCRMVGGLNLSPCDGDEGDTSPRGRFKLSAKAELPPSLLQQRVRKTSPAPGGELLFATHSERERRNAALASTERDAPLAETL